jgi:hypothetical protein
VRDNRIDGAARVPFLFLICILGLDVKVLYSMQNHVISMVTSQGSFLKKIHVYKSIIECLNDTEEILVLSTRHVNSIWSKIPSFRYVTFRIRKPVCESIIEYLNDTEEVLILSIVM